MEVEYGTVQLMNIDSMTEHRLIENYCTLDPTVCICVYMCELIHVV